jgi:hypothetical protein
MRVLPLLILAASLAAQAQPLVITDRRTLPAQVFKKTNKPDHFPARVQLLFGTRGRLDLVPIEAWERVYAVEPRTARVCVTEPIAALKAALARRGLPPPDRELPFAGCPDASAPFTVRAQRVQFKGGEGLLYISEFFTEPVDASNERLKAFFQGLSTDGRLWVGGTFEVDARGLRAKSGDLLSKAAFQAAARRDGLFLSKLPDDAFEPTMNALAEVIAGIELTGVTPND